MAPHTDRSGAEVQATVRSTRKELRKSPSECTAPSRDGGGGGGIAEAPLLRSRLCPGRFQLLSERKSWGGGGGALDANAQRTEHGAQQGPRPGERADTVGAPVKARRPGSQRRTRTRRGAPAHSHQRRPGGRPQPLPCPTPAGSAGHPPPAQSGPRPGPWRLTSPPQSACSRHRRGSDLPLLHPSPRIARRALPLSRDLGETACKAPGRRMPGVSVRPTPGVLRLGARSEPRPARGSSLVPLSAAGQASTGRLSCTVLCGIAPPNGGLLGPNFLALLTSPQLLTLRCLLELINAFLLFSKKRKTGNTMLLSCPPRTLGAVGVRSRRLGPVLQGARAGRSQHTASRSFLESLQPASTKGSLKSLLPPPQPQRSARGSAPHFQRVNHESV